MAGNFDLQIDTERIRRAAATLEEAGRAFTLAADSGGAVAMAADSLGDSVPARSAVGLVSLRAEQALDAAGQLAAISAGLVTALRLTADEFDRHDTAARLGPG